MSISIITSSFKRSDVLELFALSMDRLRQESGLDIEVYCAGDHDHADICFRHDIRHSPMGNTIVSYKFQKALNEARKRPTDMVMTLGSDDIISTDTIQAIYKAVLSHDVVGIDDVYFFGTVGEEAGELLYLPLKGMGGPCRTVSSDYLDKLGWQLWQHPANMGLDSMARRRLEVFKPTQQIIKGLLCVDVKSGINMNKFDFWKKKELINLDSQIFLSNLHQSEIDQINKIIKHNTWTNS